MTEAQRSSIVKYRKEGLGYKKISKLTGICESTIKTFCHRNGLTGETATMKKASRPTEKACQCCGKPIIQYPPSYSIPEGRRKSSAQIPAAIGGGTATFIW